MVPSSWAQTSAVKSGFTRLQTGPSHSIWSHIHIGSFSTSHLLRWIKPVQSERNITLGASSQLYIRNGLISGQDTALVGWCSHCCTSQQSTALRIPMFLRLWVGCTNRCSHCRLSGVCQYELCPFLLTPHHSALWLGNMASSLWPHCSRSLPRPKVPRVHSEWATNCWCIRWKHWGDGLSTPWSKCFWYHLGELSTAAKRTAVCWMAAKRYELGTRTIGVSSLPVTDSCSCGGMAAG